MKKYFCDICSKEIDVIFSTENMELCQDDYNLIQNKKAELDTGFTEYIEGLKVDKVAG